VPGVSKETDIWSAVDGNEHTVITVYAIKCKMVMFVTGNVHPNHDNVTSIHLTDLMTTVINHVL